jgi:ankyrin repeat protein
MRSLEDILQSTSDVLFPADLGARRVTIDSVDCDGDTPLHVMVWRKDIAAIEQLLAAGAPVNAVGDMGETPLHVAVSQELLEAVKILMRWGASPNIRSEFGDTPGERAAARGGPIALALKRGA